LAKPEGVGFADYVAMRRKIAGADGKSRSKGYSGSKGKKTQGQGLNKRSTLRPTELRTNSKGRGKASPVPPRQQRAAKSITASAKNLKQVLSRNAPSKTAKPEKRKWPKSTIDNAAKHRVKQVKTNSVQKAQTKGKTKQATPAVKAPTPTISRK
jgi:hypothetical protein